MPRHNRKTAARKGGTNIRRKGVPLDDYIDQNPTPTSLRRQMAQAEAPPQPAASDQNKGG